MAAQVNHCHDAANSSPDQSKSITLVAFDNHDSNDRSSKTKLASGLCSNPNINAEKIINEDRDGSIDDGEPIIEV